MPSVSAFAQSTLVTTSLIWNSPVTSPPSSSALMFSVWEPTPGVPVELDVLALREGRRTLPSACRRR